MSIEKIVTVNMNDINIVIEKEEDKYMYIDVSTGSYKARLMCGKELFPMPVDYYEVRR